MPGRPAQARSGTLRGVTVDAARDAVSRGWVAGGKGDGDQVGHQVVAQVPQAVLADVLAPRLAQDGGRLPGRPSASAASASAQAACAPTGGRVR